MAKGMPTQLEKAFETHFARVQYKGEEHTSATIAPSVPAEIEARVSGVHGLQPHLHPHNFLMPAQDRLLYGQFPHYVNEITHAYNITASGLTGAGSDHRHHHRHPAAQGRPENVLREQRPSPDRR